VLHALHNLAEDDPNRKTLLAALGRDDATPEEINAAIKALQDCGSIEYARNLAQERAEQGKKHLSVLQPSSEKEFLTGLIDYAVNRKL